MLKAFCLYGLQGDAWCKLLGSCADSRSAHQAFFTNSDFKAIAPNPSILQSML